MNIKLLKFIVIFFGILIIFGLIILTVGIYHKFNNLKKNNNYKNTIILKQLEGSNVEDFYVNNIAPNVSKLKFFFRAITPVGRPRRFDARFFICLAKDLNCDLDDFSNASDELSHLQWIEIEKTKEFDLPIITRIVLKKVQELIFNGTNKKGVPFYSEGSSSNNFTYL